ncbi:restriction endonuclease subunit S [Parabacteroides merdae]|uniref:restriction endonuclease subunit S n=1 Tax=Parabacteroides merdae TaxID=46503 RepID=UPI0018AA3067|nr:restriction endonuclease subunit S [Parabacteroides merdae]MDB9084299.1 restriction endonuclease subunit S [Parabacteroides merdae]
MRFPEFSGEWVTKSINDLAVVIGGGTPDTTVKSYWDGEIQWFTPSEIGKNKYVDSSLRTITEVGLNNSSAKLLPPNTILLSSRATIGECSLSLRECATNQGFQCLVSKKCNVDFLYYLIQTKKKDLIRKSCGSTFLEISANEVRKIQVSVPSDVEQQKIAELLSLIDERIATQNKIIEKLQSLIKGLSQQLLSSENDWILYRLDDLAQIKSGYSGTQVSYQTPYKVSRIETISKHCIDIQRIGYVECIPESYRLNVGNILFSNINSIQYIGNTAYLDKDYGLYHGMNLLRIIPNTTIVRPRFLHLLLCTDWAINHFQTICNKAVSQASINQTALGKSRFPIPPMSVQQQICSMFELTERKLDNEQEYISCLQQQKRYLLQKMFI